jgi:hypothetical protein
MRIVEALVAILVIAGVVLIVINQNENKKENISSQISSFQIAILREIQLNNSLRQEITAVQDSWLPVENDSFSQNASLTWGKIVEKTPGYLECVEKICATSDSCLFADSPSKTVYAQSVIISTTLQTYNPRLLKLFCWEK